MQAVEYGQANREVILLLHGGGLSWWNYETAAELLADRYHVILPILDGHGGSDRPFTTMQACAEEIIRYIDAHCGGHVRLLGGLSLGGQVLVEILSRRADICDFALIESALALPMRMTAALIRPAFALCYPLIRQRWFARLQFRELRMPSALFEEYFRDSAQIRKADMIAFLRANAAYQLREALSQCRAKTLVTAGSRERPVMKRSASAIAAWIPGAEVQILPGLYHGQLCMQDPRWYVQMLLQLMEK